MSGQVDQDQEDYQRHQAALKQQREAAQAAKAAAMREAFIDAMNFKWDCPVLKVFIRDGKVVRPTLNDGKAGQKILGDVEGAKAGMTGQTRRAGLRLRRRVRGRTLRW
ncbi:MAG TPA: hypothetical protein VIY52_31350 [Streptosporangiaceae bacterium]